MEEDRTLALDSDNAYLGMTSLSPDSCIICTERHTTIINLRGPVFGMSGTLLMFDHIIFQKKLLHILAPFFPPLEQSLRATERLSPRLSYSVRSLNNTQLVVQW